MNTSFLCSFSLFLLVITLSKQQRKKDNDVLTEFMLLLAVVAVTIYLILSIFIFFFLFYIFLSWDYFAVGVCLLTKSNFRPSFWHSSWVSKPRQIIWKSKWGNWFWILKDLGSACGDVNYVPIYFWQQEISVILFFHEKQTSQCKFIGGINFEIHFCTVCPIGPSNKAGRARI